MHVMKRTRSIGNGTAQGKAVIAGDNGDTALVEDPLGAPVPALPVANPPGVVRSILPVNLSPETLAMATATANHVKGLEDMPTYTPIPHTLIPPPSDQIAAIRNIVLHSVKSSNIAVGWCSRWPRIASVDVLLRFSEDAISFFSIPANLQNVFQDPGRRSKFSNLLSTMHVLINTHLPDFNEYLNASSAAAEYKMNKFALVLEQRTTAIFLMKDEVAPCSPTLLQDITAYYTQTSAAYTRLAKIIIRLEKVLIDFHDIFLQLRETMLAEVPEPIRDLLFPQ